MGSSRNAPRNAHPHASSVLVRGRDGDEAEARQLPWAGSERSPSIFSTRESIYAAELEERHVREGL